MSSIQGILDSPNRVNLTMVYADPAGLNNIVVGSENRTGIDLFNLSRSNVIIDARATTSPATTDNMRFSIRRLNGNVSDIALWTDILPDNTRTVKGVIPKGVNPGSFQWIMEEIVIAAAGVTVEWTFANPLAM